LKLSFQQIRPALFGAIGGLLALVLLIWGLNGFALPFASNVEQPTASPTSTASVAPSESITPTETPTLVRACSVADSVNATSILDLQAEVLNASTGEVLFDRAASVAARPASIMKLFTAAAALEQLGPDFTVTTRVYQDASDPGKIYLVGAGDPTLTRTTSSGATVYRNAPKLTDLARQVEKSTGEQITEIVLDSTLYGGESGDYQSVWDPRGITEGYMAPVAALMVDADRKDPQKQTSPRSEDPIQRAGDWFKQVLGAQAIDAQVSKGVATADAKQIAAVESAPISDWIPYMLRVSDNQLAEALARLVALDLNLAPEFSSLTPAIVKALANTGLTLTGLRLEDGSGLSKFNTLPPALANDLLVLVNQGYGDFEIIESGMPVSGQSGSLSARFADEQADSHDLIIAKTGWIRTGYTLAGFADAVDGTRLIFTVYNLGTSVSLANRAAMDDLVYAMFKCGNQLSNQ
jgi:D-alanyl-D-alanine carboxypeptidase/D-alanyl-D-alanine-endopeptidase (penicillin-binding protein 4)